MFRFFVSVLLVTTSTPFLANLIFIPLSNRIVCNVIKCSSFEANLLLSSFSVHSFSVMSQKNPCRQKENIVFLLSVSSIGSINVTTLQWEGHVFTSSKLLQPLTIFGMVSHTETHSRNVLYKHKVFIYSTRQQ